MAAIYSLFILILASSAYSIKDFTDEELTELRNGTFVELPLVTGGNDLESPARSIQESVDKLKKACECDGKICYCCYKTTIALIPFKACLNLEFKVEEKSFLASLTIAGISAYSGSVNVKQLEKACKKIPKAESVELCMYVSFTEEEGSIISCMSLDLQYKEQTLATLNFQCVSYDYTQKTLSYPDKDTGREALAKLNVKNPIELVASLIQSLVEG